MPSGARVVAVVGPPAARKSEAALRIAEALGADVVNADSMQLYRGMDVGTAKLTPEERRGITHHLLDVWDVTRAASVAAYQRMAREVLDRLDVAVVAGGSGLYVRGALDALDFPGTDAETRATLEAELEQHGPQALYERLRQQDPLAASRIQPENGRRIVRALEVVALTGRPFSDNAGMEAYVSAYDTTYAGLAPDMDTLDERIDRRVDLMWERGLVAEVTDLAERHGLRDGVTARRALGYRQVLAFLDGETTEDAAREETKRATRRFARRQLSWFRRDPRIAWYADADALVTATVTRR